MPTPRTQPVPAQDNLAKQVDDLLDDVDRSRADLEDQVQQQAALESQVQSLLSQNGTAGSHNGASAAPGQQLSSLDAQLAALVGTMLDGDIQEPVKDEVEPAVEEGDIQPAAADGASAPEPDIAAPVEDAAVEPVESPASEASVNEVLDVEEEQTEDSAVAAAFEPDAAEPQSPEAAVPEATPAPEPAPAPEPTPSPVAVAPPAAIHAPVAPPQSSHAASTNLTPPPVATSSTAAPTSPSPAVALPTMEIGVPAKRRVGVADLAHRIAALISAPLHGRPRIIRDTIGWLALWTLFLAACVLMAVVFFRKPQTPDIEANPAGVVAPDHESPAETPHEVTPGGGADHEESSRREPRNGGWQIRTSEGH